MGIFSMIMVKNLKGGVGYTEGLRMNLNLNIFDFLNKILLIIVE